MEKIFLATYDPDGESLQEINQYLSNGWKVKMISKTDEYLSAYVVLEKGDDTSHLTDKLE